MSVLNKRGILSALVFLVIVGTAVAIWGVPRFIHRKASIKGQVNTFLLDERGGVNGLLLSTGDQIHFSPELGTLVGTQLKIGDEVTVSGHAGMQTSYGREIHGEQLAFNGQTLLEVPAGPKPRHPDGGPGERERGPRPGPPANAPAPAPEQSQNSPTPVGPAPLPTPEVVKVSGSLKTHLVNGRGDVDGLILSSGEQVRFPPNVGELIVSAEQSGNSSVTVEGAVVKNDRGVVINPTYITVGSQTISLGH
ncbi:MAG TPA: hypothetical protein VI306_24670 [Pyrinomonadaceae bacterium]